MAENTTPKTVKVLIEREYDEQEYVFVGINGTNYQIKVDEEVEVPWEVNEVLKTSKQAKAETIKRARNKGKK